MLCGWESSSQGLEKSLWGYRYGQHIHYRFFFFYSLFIRIFFLWFPGPLYSCQQSPGRQCHDIVERSKGRPCGFGLRWWSHCKLQLTYWFFFFFFFTGEQWVWPLRFQLLRFWKPVDRVLLLLLVMSSTHGLFACLASMHGEQAIAKKWPTDGKISGRFDICRLMYLKLFYDYHWMVFESELIQTC